MCFGGTIVEKHVSERHNPNEGDRAYELCIGMYGVLFFLTNREKLLCTLRLYRLERVSWSEIHKHGDIQLEFVTLVGTFPLKLLIISGFAFKFFKKHRVFQKSRFKHSIQLYRATIAVFIRAYLYHRTASASQLYHPYSVSRRFPFERNEILSLYDILAIIACYGMWLNNFPTDISCTGYVPLYSSKCHPYHNTVQYSRNCVKRLLVL